MLVLNGHWSLTPFSVCCLKNCRNIRLSRNSRNFESAANLDRKDSHVEHKQTWQGFRFQSSDNRHIAQFAWNGFVFSRLSPYEDWTKFEAEALRLWRIYRDVGEPSENQRLGIRFIDVIDEETLEQVLLGYPNP